MLVSIFQNPQCRGVANYPFLGPSCVALYMWHMGKCAEIQYAGLLEVWGSLVEVYEGLPLLFYEI